MREPGEIHHMHDIVWKGLAVVYTYIFEFYWEKCDRKTAGLSKFKSPGTDMLTWVKTTRNVSILVIFLVLGF